MGRGVKKGVIKGAHFDARYGLNSRLFIKYSELLYYSMYDNYIYTFMDLQSVDTCNLALHKVMFFSDCL